MSVVLLSSESFCRSDEVASRVARDLGYDVVGREIEAAAATTFNVPVEKLRQAFTPSLLTKLSRSRKRNLAYFQACLVAALCRNNIVYYGDVGHMLVSDVSHVVKVKVTATLEDRVARCMAERKVSEKQVRDLLRQESAQRDKWFSQMLGVDGYDSSVFDLVVDLTDSGLDGTCKAIVETTREDRFRSVTYSIKTLRDHELACRVRATLIKDYPDVAVTARDGEVRIEAKPLARDKGKKASAARSLVLGLEGVTHVRLE